MEGTRCEAAPGVRRSGWDAGPRDERLEASRSTVWRRYAARGRDVGVWEPQTGVPGACHRQVCDICIPNNFKGWKLWDPSAQGGCGNLIMSWDVIWDKSKFPGLLKEAHNSIPVHFGCTKIDKPLLDAPHFKEIDDCHKPERAQLFLALDDLKDNLPPLDVEVPLLLPLPNKSDNSNFKNNAAPSTKTLLSLSSLSEASPPHTPLHSTTVTAL
jgi:hypothetical protein